MSEIKYNVSIINSKWETIKRNIEISIIPRKDEYIFYNDEYHNVTNVIHRFNYKHEIFIVIEKLENQEIKIINEKS